MKKILALCFAALLLATGAFAAFEKVNTYDNNFSDVKDTNWFAKDVKSAYELGFMNGKAEGLFDPNGNVTVAEGITMAARVHAIYNGNEIKKEEAPAAAPAGDEIRFDFDTMDGHRLNHAVGDVEDGILVMKPDAPNAGGNFDLGVFMDEVSIDASVYKTMKVRMKREALENINERRETFEIFFGSEENSTLGAEGNFLYTAIKDATTLDDWYEYTFDMSAAAGWKGNIVQVRFDPTNNNGEYFIDYIVFTSASAPKVEEPKKDPKWYDMYVDYAVANGIITKTTFGNYDKNISRADLANLFAKALPESYFNAINDIKGIPDVKKTDKYAKELLMLYNAGVVLGDADGNFKPASDIMRSEVAAIINRVALPESRVTGTVDAVWEEDKPVTPVTPEVPKADENAADDEHVATPFDVEFNDASDLDFFEPGEVDSAEIVDGALIMVARDRGAERMPQYDPRLVMTGVEIDASVYKKIKIRLKAEFIGDVTNGYNTDIYFMTEGDENFSEEKSLHPNLLSVSKMDEEGWYLVEIDLTEKNLWNGTVTAFRFDPSNNNGVFSFDYIRFAE